MALGCPSRPSVSNSLSAWVRPPIRSVLPSGVSSRRALRALIEVGALGGLELGEVLVLAGRRVDRPQRDAVVRARLLGDQLGDLGGQPQRHADLAGRRVDHDQDVGALLLAGFELRLERHAEELRAVERRVGDDARLVELGSAEVVGERRGPFRLGGNGAVATEPVVSFLLPGRPTGSVWVRKTVSASAEPTTCKRRNVVILRTP